MDNQKYIDEKKFIQILEQAKKNLRDYLLIYMSYRHGLRQREVSMLTWSMVNWQEDLIWIPRVKHGISGYHPLNKEEKKNLLKYYSNLRKKGKNNRYIFPIALRTIREIANKYGIRHHQLRHTCGFHMARAGIDVLKIKSWLGHKDVKNTLIYISESGIQFENLPFWEIV